MLGMRYCVSVSKRYVGDLENRQKVVAAYKAHDKPTIPDLAVRLGTTYHNVMHILREELPAEEYAAEKALRYSRSKMAEKNPMSGKSGSQHHNHIGDIEDGHGYMMRKVGGRYEQVHRLVMAEALGLPILPRKLHVHHIDEDKKNNSLDNLALVTPVGHRTLHRTTGWNRSPLWEQWVSGTSKSQETTPTGAVVS